MNNPIPVSPTCIILKYPLFFIGRYPDAIIFQDEIESFRSFMIRDNEIFYGHPVGNRITGNMVQNVVEEVISINFESFCPEPDRNRPGFYPEYPQIQVFSEHPAMPEGKAQDFYMIQ